MKAAPEAIARVLPDHGDNGFDTYGDHYVDDHDNHDDYGDYIRRLGSRLAITNNFFAVTYLDADNYWDKEHLKKVLKCYKKTGKKIIISKRFLVKEGSEKIIEPKMNFFDTNTYTFFEDLKKIGLLWSRYPKEMSLIGDRIISMHIKTFYKDDIAILETPTINYRFAPIPKYKQKKLISWYNNHYDRIRLNFKKRFGFNLIL